MSYMGRGQVPTPGKFINHLGRNNQDSNYDDDKDEYQGPRFRMYLHRNIVYDNTYVIMQMITIFGLILIGGLAFVFTYKTQIIDPIKDVKKLFLNTHIFSIVIVFLLMILVNYISKTKDDLMKRLILIFSFSTLITFAFLGIRINFDSKYNRTQFSKIYDSEIGYTASNTKNTGVIQFKSYKNYYVDECLKLYNIFQAKSYAILALHVWIDVSLFMQIIRLTKEQEGKDRLDKDDKILFDEEQNCRY